MVWAMPRSLATTKGITFVLFSCRYLDVSVPCVCLPYGMICLQHTGLTHSEISASRVICTYTELIAAYHVLHRLWEPRHPPYALIFLLDYLLSLSYITHILYNIYLISVICVLFTSQNVKEQCHTRWLRQIKRNRTFSMFQKSVSIG